MITLEQEFTDCLAQHKYAVLKAKIVDYYRTLEMGKVNLPDFVRNDSPEVLADRDLRHILCGENGLEKFNELYEAAWNSIAELLD